MGQVQHGLEQLLITVLHWLQVCAVQQLQEPRHIAGQG